MMSRARFLLSKSEALKRFDDLKKISDIVSYSHKTNPEISKVLIKEDCLFSVHTLDDLKELDGTRVLFFGQAWDNDELYILFSKKVTRLVVDNESDLNQLLKYLEGKSHKIILFLRMKLKENTIHTGKHFVYGMYSSRVNELLKTLKQNKNIAELGIHFHRKTQNVSEWSIQEELYDSIDDWSNISYVNIGGGVPAEYKNFNSSVLKSIFDKISDMKKWLNEKNIKMIIEPGRYLAAYPVKLEANIKAIYDSNIIIDCSVYNAAMDTFVAHIRLVVEDEVEEGQGEPYTIKGLTPDSMDIFRYRVFLRKPKVGDKLVFLNAGAYTYSTDFCNLPKLETVFVD